MVIGGRKGAFVCWSERVALGGGLLIACGLVGGCGDTIVFFCPAWDGCMGMGRWMDRTEATRVQRSVYVSILASEPATEDILGSE